jgi:hypothetical protein
MSEFDEPRPMLRRLATRLGIVDSYVDQTGGHVRQTTDHTRERLLLAMGYEASTEEDARAVLIRLRRIARRTWIDPVRVVRQRSKSLSRVVVRVPTMHAEEVRWTLVLVTEEGTEQRWHGVTHGGPTHRTQLLLPIKPPLGYHDLHVAPRSAAEWATWLRHHDESVHDAEQLELGRGRRRRPTRACGVAW